MKLSLFAIVLDVNLISRLRFPRLKYIKIFLSEEKEAGKNDEEASMIKMQSDDYVTSEEIDDQLKQVMANTLTFQKYRSCNFLSNDTAATTDLKKRLDRAKYCFRIQLFEARLAPYW